MPNSSRSRRWWAIGAAVAVGAIPLTLRVLDAHADTVAPPNPAAGDAFDFGNPQVVATGLDAPSAIAFLPDGSALVAERSRGTVLRIRPGTAAQQVTTIDGVQPDGDGGLLGLAVSPGFTQDGMVYAYYSTATDNRIARFRLDAPQNQQVIFSGPDRSNVHNGGPMTFGPDGMLYVGVGDASVRANAQDPASLNGKILRMTTDGTAPADNPFPGSLVYSLGHPNVQGLAWDQQGRLYATESGADDQDDVNLITAGADYGRTGGDGQDSGRPSSDPIVSWPPTDASPAGAAFANGTLFVAGLDGDRLWTVPITNAARSGNATPVLQGQFGRLRSVQVAPDGALWLATSNRDGQGQPGADDDRIIRIPCRIAPSGSAPAIPTPTATRPPLPTPTPTATTTPTPVPSLSPRPTPTPTTPTPATPTTPVTPTPTPPVSLIPVPTNFP